MPKKQKETYVIGEIETALFDLLEHTPLEKLSIGQITTAAQVSRSSFYRNFDSKEAIIIDCIYRKLRNWQADFERDIDEENIHFSFALMWQSLFTHMRNDQRFYYLLEKNNLFHLVSEAMNAVTNPKEHLPDGHAFALAFTITGLFGWIREWVRRGMPDEQSKQVMEYLAEFGTS